MVDIVYVNWNSGHDLFNSCVSVINLQSRFIGNIIVVDNNSSDQSFELVKDLEGIVLVESNENLGFARGCNLGANYTKSEYILFLNPDTVVPKDIFEDCVNVFLNDKVVGILGVKILDNFGYISRSCSRFPKLYQFISQIFAIDKTFPSTGSRMAEWSHDNNQYVDQVIGAFFLMPRKLFIELNGFDERFFMYYEEVDLAFRSSLLGFKSYYLSTVFIVHEGGGASKKVKSKRLFYSMRSRLQYAKKHFNYFEYSVLIFFTLFIEPFSRIFFNLLKFRTNDASETVIGFYKLYMYLIFDRIEKK
jgi:N-acetylglucosaminyl-diphospho-decaprenol L-rhamnosyltransferase